MAGAWIETVIELDNFDRMTKHVFVYKDPADHEIRIDKYIVMVGAEPGKYVVLQDEDGVVVSSVLSPWAAVKTFLRLEAKERGIID